MQSIILPSSGNRLSEISATNTMMRITTEATMFAGNNNSSSAIATNETSMASFLLAAPPSGIHFWRYDDPMEHSIDVNTSFRLLLYALYFLIFVIGITGNILVVVVVFRQQTMHTVTNLFIANLALSDILLCLFCVPFTPLYLLMFKEWVFGSFFCRIVPLAQGVSVYISVLTLMMIALERYTVIVHPLLGLISVRNCYWIILCIWIAAFVLTLPYGIFIEVVNTVYVPPYKFNDKFNLNNQNDINDRADLMQYANPTADSAAASAAATTTTPMMMMMMIMGTTATPTTTPIIAPNYRLQQNLPFNDYNQNQNHNHHHQQQQQQTKKKILHELFIRAKMPRMYCHEMWPNETLGLLFGVCTMFAQFVVPFVIITYCYAKVCMRLWTRVHRRPGTCNNVSNQRRWFEKHRARRTNIMLISMVVIFVVSWLPLNTYNLLEDLYSSMSTWKHSKTVFVCFHLVAMSSAVYHPFFTLLSDHFRKEFKNIFTSILARLGLRFHTTSGSGGAGAGASIHHPHHHTHANNHRNHNQSKTNQNRIRDCTQTTDLNRVDMRDALCGATNGNNANDENGNDGEISMTMLDTTTNLVTNLESINEVELQESLLVTSIHNGIYANRLLLNSPPIAVNTSDKL